ncbi:MAG: helix-turn-helix transcriptional regulator, partial [Terriglobia bacterium]
RLSNRLKRHRKASAFTQSELVFLLGLKSHSAISRYEADERTPDLGTAFAYEILFEKKLGELFPGLFADVKSQVAARAWQLADALRKGPMNLQAAYKLERLAHLEQDGVPNLPAV